MKIKGTLFDINGQSYAVDNVDIYVGEMKDRLLVETYKSTIYQHELTLAMEELVQKGLVKEAIKAEPYEAELTMNAISSMRDELVERFDKKFHDEVVNSIDLSFTKKKPKNL